MFHPENNRFPISGELLLPQQKDNSQCSATESFVSCAMPISYSFPVAKSSYAVHNSSGLRDASSQNATIWNLNCIGGSSSDTINATYGNYTYLSMPMIVGGLSPEPSRQLYSSYPNVYTNAESASGSNIHSEDRQKAYQDAPIDCSAFHSSLMGVHSAGSDRIQADYMTLDDTGGHDSLPSCFGNSVAYSKLRNVPGWDHSFAARKSEASCYNANEQLQHNVGLDMNGRSGLSLSLSSIPSAELEASQFDARFRYQEVPFMGIDSHHCTEELRKNLDTLYQRQFPDHSLEPTEMTVGISSNDYSNPIGCHFSSSRGEHSVSGPLGPFTGYSTILNRSKFLSPAQQLLDEFISGRGGPIHRVNEPDTHQVGSFSRGDGLQFDLVSCDAVDKLGVDVRSILHSSSLGISPNLAIEDTKSNVLPQGTQIGYPQKRMKLVAMLHEVIRRYDYYNQQIKMVLSSFQSVSGLRTATPYVSYSVKMILKHFRSLKHMINSQLQDSNSADGADTDSCFAFKGEAQRFKCISDESLRAQRIYVDDQPQPVWRPQRGLPERAVSVLRAWLFEHFLHPYPTDSDKHMLASQTGLSRNQVSNWFINARVRIWKPMVEEIHMLETQKASDGKVYPSNNPFDQNPTTLQPSSTEGPPQQIQEGCSSYIGQNTGALGMGDIPVTGDQSIQLNDLMMKKQKSVFQEFGFYPHDVNIGGLGAVSLTLGLKHNEGMQRDYADISNVNDDMLQ